MGEGMAEEKLADIESHIKQSFVLQRVGLMVTAMESENTNKSQLRELIRHPLREIRAKYGTDAEQELMPPLLLKKIQDCINLKS
eukprot:6464849-Amphidinium_carterae.4